MQKVRVRVRRKGQITLPQRIRDEWKIEEGSEIEIITVQDDQAILKPVKRTRIEEEAGSLGPPDRDEINFALTDPELMSLYYSKKYK